MASYNGSHVPKLSHLWQLAVRAQRAPTAAISASYYIIR